MSKYDGIKKVDFVLNENEAVEKRKRSAGDFLFRAFAAALITAVPFCLKAVGNGYTDKAVAAVKTAVTFDVLSGENQNGAEIAFIELIKEYADENDSDK